MTEEEDYHRFLFSDLLRCFAETDLNDNKRHADDVWVTSRREVVSMTREDSIGDTTGSSTASDESSSLLSGAGANVVETRKQSETVRNIVKYLQVITTVVYLRDRRCIGSQCGLRILSLVKKRGEINNMKGASTSWLRLSDDSIRMNKIKINKYVVN